MYISSKLIRSALLKLSARIRARLFASNSDFRVFSFGVSPWLFFHCR